MAIHFQQLTVTDTPLLAGHLVGWHRQDGLSLSVAAAERQARRLLASPQDFHAWLIRHGDRAVGYLVLGFRSASGLQAPGASVAALYVEPALRSRGIGARALRFVHDIGRWLHVRIAVSQPAQEDHHFGRLAPTVAGGAGWAATIERRAIA